LTRHRDTFLINCAVSELVSDAIIIVKPTGGSNSNREANRRIELKS
jgi:hypothetical protein